VSEADRRRATRTSLYSSTSQIELWLPRWEWNLSPEPRWFLSMASLSALSAGSHSCSQSNTAAKYRRLAMNRASKLAVGGPLDVALMLLVPSCFSTKKTKDGFSEQTRARVLLHSLHELVLEFRSSGNTRLTTTVASSWQLLFAPFTMPSNSNLRLGQPLEDRVSRASVCRSSSALVPKPVIRRDTAGSSQELLVLVAASSDRD
jgi:hypothetical protein